MLSVPIAGKSYHGTGWMTHKVNRLVFLRFDRAQVGSILYATPSGKLAGTPRSRLNLTVRTRRTSCGEQQLLAKEESDETNKYFPEARDGVAVLSWRICDREPRVGRGSWQPLQGSM
jgi:hypothetical protein